MEGEVVMNSILLPRCKRKNCNGTPIIFAWVISWAFLACSFTARAEAPSNSLRDSASNYLFSPEPLGVPVKNPLTGWRGKRGPEDGNPPGIKGKGVFTVDGKYETLKKWYIGWNEIENQECDGVEKIHAFLNQEWKELPAQNTKAIPRIVLIDNVGAYAPKDLPPFLAKKENYRNSPWYSRPEVKARLERLIYRLGVIWDNDPRVAWVEMGVQGKYAEQWDLDQMPEFAFWLSDQFKKNFKNKKVLIRSVGLPGWGKDTWDSVKIANDYPFGFYEDSFGKPSYECEKETIEKLDCGNRWKTAVIGGETGVTRLEKSPFPLVDREATITNQLSGAGLQYLADWTREVHASFLGWDLSFPIPCDHPGTIALRRTLGYHFVITRYQQSREVKPGGTLDLSFAVKNRGSAPFYYRWPVEVSLVNEASREKAFSKRLDGVDIRQWLPGEDWNPKIQEYNKQAPEILVNASIPLPQSLKPGIYVVTLAILDPEGGNLPCVRFEIKNYWQGGLHPMGRLGVSAENKNPAVDPGSFYTDPVDPKVQYELPAR
jgi:hypothetical protein